MFFKKKITLELFVKEHFLPLIKEATESELDLLYEDISKVSNLQIEKNILSFELFLLFVYLSGRGLSTINGFDFNTGVKFNTLIDKTMQEKFTNLKLNQKWLDKERGVVLSDMFNYYKNKSTAYREAELSYHNGQIDKDELSKQICKIFFSIENDDVDAHLITVMGEIHKGGFMFLYEKLSNYAKEYKLA